MARKRKRPRVLFTGNPESAREGRCEPDPDLPGLSLGERIQRMVQWNAPPRGYQFRMVHNDQAGKDRDQLLAQATQPHPPPSGPQHAPTSPRNSSPKWPRTWGLDSRTRISRVSSFASTAHQSQHFRPLIGMSTSSNAICRSRLMQFAKWTPKRLTHFPIVSRLM